MTIIMRNPFFLILFMGFISLKLSTGQEVPVWSAKGVETLQLYTETAYAIVNKGTGTLPCTNLTNLGQVDFLNLDHWWTIKPSSSGDARSYEVTNNGKGKCSLGRQILFNPTNQSDDVFLLSSIDCREVKGCAGRGMMHNGQFYNSDGKEVIEFCGNLNFTCTYSKSTRRKQFNSMLATQGYLPGAYQYQFIPLWELLREKYTVSAIVQNFKFEEITEQIRKNFATSRPMGLGWRIGVDDRLENCAHFEQEREIGMTFNHTETASLIFSNETKNLNRKISKNSIGGGISVSLPLIKYVSPSLSVSAGIQWGSDKTTSKISSKTEMNEVSKTVEYEYVSTVMVKPWTVANVTTTITVIKNIPIKWTAEIVVSLKDLSGNLECLEKNKMYDLLNILGYEPRKAEWLEHVKAFKFPAEGFIQATFGTESHVTVTTEPCPEHTQVHRDEM